MYITQYKTDDGAQGEMSERPPILNLTRLCRKVSHFQIASRLHTETYTRDRSKVVKSLAPSLSTGQYDNEIQKAIVLCHLQSLISLLSPPKPHLCAVPGERQFPKPRIARASS